MKKLVLVCLSVVLCLSVFAFTGCGNDDSAIQNRLDALEQENQDLQKQINDLEEQLKPTTVPVYGLLDTATVVQNGIEMISITYMQNTTSGRFSVKNHNMPGLREQMLSAMRYSSTEKTFSFFQNTFDSVIPLGESRSLSMTVSSWEDYIYFGFPTVGGGYIPYAIFKV